MFSRPKILFLVSLLFVALLNPKFNPYLPFKFLIFYHIYIYIYNITCLLFCSNEYTYIGTCVDVDIYNLYPSEAIHQRNKVCCIAVTAV